MSSMMADVRGAAVAPSRIRALSAEGQFEAEGEKLDVSALLGVALRVVQVLVLVRMLNLFFGWV